jgi:hypothetical protein
MALPEHLAEFERRVATRLADAVEEMRRSLHAQAERASSQLLTDIEAFRPEMPQRLLEDSELAGLAAPSHDAARRELVQELLGALAALDATTTQSDALAALLAAARAGGGRAAVWLTQEEALVGWGSAGFAANGGPDPLAGRRLGYTFSPALERLGRGRGVVRLDRSDAARLASELEVSAPHAAILVPLVLRDRLAAALYVDRAEGEIEIERLQVLSYAAAQRLELQALSTRSFTPTLVLEENAPAGVAGLPLWNADEVAAAVAMTADAAGLDVALQANNAALDVAPAAPAPDFEPFRFEPEAAEPATELASDPAAEWRRDTETLPPVAFDEPVFELAPPEEETLYEGEPDTLAEPIPLGAVDRPAPPFPAEVSAPRVETGAAAEIAWEMVESEPAAPEKTAPFADELDSGAATGQVSYSELWGKAALSSPAPLAPSSPAPLAPFQREISGETPVIESTAEFMPPPAPYSPAPPSPQVTQAIRPGSIATHEFELPATAAEEVTDLTEDATVLLRRAPEAPAPAAADETAAIPYSAFAPPAPTAPIAPIAPPPADEEPTVSRARTTEVVPPPDVQGPGWAFTSSRVPRATGENALHEEARRLARLLISEIKLYNEEQVEEGRRNRDIYERLKDDIDRSRQMYDERVDPQILRSTDYFYQELVRILAAGDSKALGI